jgi:CcmD family protein
MKNMNYLVAAYVAIWAIFCVYLISIARRMASLQDDIRRLKEGGK